MPGAVAALWVAELLAHRLDRVPGLRAVGHLQRVHCPLHVCTHLERAALPRRSGRSVVQLERHVCVAQPGDRLDLKKKIYLVLEKKSKYFFPTKTVNMEIFPLVFKKKTFSH